MQGNGKPRGSKGPVATVPVVENRTKKVPGETLKTPKKLLDGVFGSSSVPAAAVRAAAPAASAKPPAGKQRKRLAKAFPRPLDKVLKKGTKAGSPSAESATVRDGFTFPVAEYAVLVGIKKRLAEQGVKVKKSELIRVGLALLSALPSERIKSALAKLPSVPR